MATPIPRAITATKHTRKHGPHDFRAHRLDAGHNGSRAESDGRECPAQKIRKRARTIVGDELDFVFRL